MPSYGTRIGKRVALGGGRRVTTIMVCTTYKGMRAREPRVRLPLCNITSSSYKALFSSTRAKFMITWTSNDHRIRGRRLNFPPFFLSLSLSLFSHRWNAFHVGLDRLQRAETNLLGKNKATIWRNCSRYFYLSYLLACNFFLVTWTNKFMKILWRFAYISEKYIYFRFDETSRVNT